MFGLLLKIFKRIYHPFNFYNESIMHFNLLISVFIFSLMANFVIGQAKIVNPESTKVVRNRLTTPAPLSTARSIRMDTLCPTIVDTDVCSDSIFNHPSNEYGYVGGTNDFMDFEKAQLFIFDDDDNYTVTEAFIFMGVAVAVGDGQVVAKIYEATENGPGDLVGTSEPVNVSALVLDDFIAVPTQFIFSTETELTTDNFFVSLDVSELYSLQDTASILMTNLDCGVIGEAWELFGDGTTWISIADENSWNIESNFFMAAIVETDGVTATKELVVGNQRISLHDAFPNPTNGQLTISFDLEKSATIQIIIYSLAGQVIQQIDKNRLPAGQYQEQISTDNLATGTYFYGIKTDSGRLMNKFTVSK